MASTAPGMTLFGQVVNPFELGVAVRRRHLADIEQPLQHSLDARPVPTPVGAIALLSNLQISGADRAARGDLISHERDEVGVLPRDPLHSCPDIAKARLHAEPEQGLEGNIDQAGGVAPVLEKATGSLIGGAFDERRIVGSEPGEQRHEMRTLHNIDRVDLKLRQPVRHRLNVAHGEWPIWPRHTKALRSERDPPRLSLAERLPSHAYDASATH